MPSINVDLDYFAHAKTIRLIGLLGKGSEVLPIRMWIYAGKYHAESGRLVGYSTQEIETVVAWWGERGRAVDALLRVKFLDRTPGGYQIHNWPERAGHLAVYKRRAKVAAKAKWAKYNARFGHSPPVPSPDPNPGKDASSILQECNVMSSEGGLEGELSTAKKAALEARERLKQIAYGAKVRPSSSLDTEERKQFLKAQAAKLLIGKSA